MRDRTSSADATSKATSHVIRIEISAAAHALINTPISTAPMMDQETCLHLEGGHELVQVCIVLLLRCIAGADGRELMIQLAIHKLLQIVPACTKSLRESTAQPTVCNTLLEHCLDAAQ